MELRTWDEWVALVVGPGGILLCWLGYLAYVAYRRKK